MLNNLKTELIKKHRTIGEYAEYIGVSKSTAMSYITEKSDISKAKMDKTKELFPECTYEYLFESQKDDAAVQQSICGKKAEGRLKNEGTDRGI
jgi:plasmid maintenance system antidote protein VapI